MSKVDLGIESGFEYVAYAAKLEGFIEGAKAATEYARHLFLEQLVKSSQKVEQKKGDSANDVSATDATATKPTDGAVPGGNESTAAATATEYGRYGRWNSERDVAGSDAVGSNASDGRDASRRTADRGSAELPRDGSAAQSAAKPDDADAATHACAVDATPSTIPAISSISARWNAKHSGGGTFYK